MSIFSKRSVQSSPFRRPASLFLFALPGPPFRPSSSSRSSSSTSVTTHTPSTPLDLPTTSLRHAVSLRLVNSSFHAIIDHSLLLFRSVLLRTPYDWLRYFDPKKGVLVMGKQARRRCEAVQEIVFSFSAPELPLRKGFTPDEMGTDTQMYAADAHMGCSSHDPPLLVDHPLRRPGDRTALGSRLSYDAVCVATRPTRYGRFA
jgi:hypothetical protein